MRRSVSFLMSLVLSVMSSTVALHYFEVARVVRAHHHHHHHNTSSSSSNAYSGSNREEESGIHKSPNEGEQDPQDLEGSFLFISKRFFQRIPDECTKDFMLRSLKLAEPVEVTVEDLAHHRLEEGPPVPSMCIPDDNNDHITLKHMLLFETVQGAADLLHDLTQLDDCYNPSVATYTPPAAGSGDGAGSGLRYLLACRSHGNLHGPMTLAWLDPASNFQVHPSAAFLGIGPGKTQVDYVDGEDYRLFDPQDGSGRLVVTYTFYPDNRFAQMRMATLMPAPSDDLTQARLSTHSDYVLIPSAKQQELERARTRRHGQPEQDYRQLHQKNWCPFLAPPPPSPTNQSHQSPSSPSMPPELHLIKYIHPLEVVQILPLHSGSAEYEELQLSQEGGASASRPDPTPPPSLEWDYGELRGGTAALRVRPDLFLAFFHSKWRLPGSRLISYFFGAYTFDARPPFHLKAVSRFPLTHRSFYDGPWSTVYRNMIDYIVFPMSFVVLPANLTSLAPVPPWSPLCEERCLRATQLLLSVGVQDRDGWLARLSLGRLLDSLVPVNDYDNDNDSSRPQHHQPSPPPPPGRRGRP